MYKYLNNIELEEAIKVYGSKIIELGFLLGEEEILVKDSLHRITSQAVYAKISSPHYNACAMDGIAVCASKTFGATETTPAVLSEGTDFIRVDTGDPLPAGFDAVVMIEDVIQNSDGTILLYNAAAPWQYVRQIGEDLCAHEMILPSNTRIEPAAIGAILAGGIEKVRVRKKPLVGLIPTGDEIVSPTDNPKEGEIIEFNSSIFSAMLESWGAVSKVYRIVPDRFELIQAALTEAASECDIVILNAGSSAGREDYSEKAISTSGEVFIHGIAIRPGKPAILGIVNSRPVIGVPGYPVSGIIVMDKLVKPVLEMMSGIEFESSDKVKAALSRKIVSSLKYKEFIRVKLGKIDGKYVATPLNRGAGVVTSFVKADGILELPMNLEGLEAGSEIEVNLLKTENEIQNTLLITGSHDPLIDTVSDIMRRRYPNFFISSAHVGSLGGIMAVKRNETHIAGMHLLEEETGEYNDSYIRKYLGDGNTLVIKCVKRLQGLMVPPGNPKAVYSLRDIASSGFDNNIRYVNRQKGSGTRILLDYLLKKEKISSTSIYGYDREEFTHLSVAALIASGSADVGMGIYSAAKIYGLEFIPVCEEQYDFILPIQYGELEHVKYFIEILKSEEFKSTLNEMGGYVLENTGDTYII